MLTDYLDLLHDWRERYKPTTPEEMCIRDSFFCEKMHFLRAGEDKRLDAYKTPHPAATGQVDVVGGFKVVAAVILAQFCAETDGII